MSSEFGTLRVIPPPAIPDMKCGRLTTIVQGHLPFQGTIKDKIQMEIQRTEPDYSGIHNSEIVDLMKRCEAATDI